MQEHLHQTAALLDRIAKSTDTQEREKLMQQYRQSVRTGMKIDRLMQGIAADPETPQGGGMMAKGKKKMGGGMSCCKMMGKKATAKSDDAGEAHNDHDAGAAPEGDDSEDEAAAPAGSHEGH